MYVFMTLVNPLIVGNEITLKMILIGIPIWTIAGLGFGYTMKYFMGKRAKSLTKQKFYFLNMKNGKRFMLILKIEKNI